MPIRKIPLVKDEIYHIYTRSISGLKVFNDNHDYRRFLGAIRYYSLLNPPCRLSSFNEPIELTISPDGKNPEKLVQIICYCIMPNHIHIMIKEIRDGGISNFLNLLLKSYGKYFNAKRKRKGPLWEGPFKNVLVSTSEQFAHLTRYIHLNPVTAFMVDSPRDWQYSSYREFIDRNYKYKMCDFNGLLDESYAGSYEKFVNGQISHQRMLGIVKNLTLE